MTNPYDQPAGIYVWESTAANTELLGTIYAMSTQGRWGGGGGGKSYIEYPRSVVTHLINSPIT